MERRVLHFTDSPLYGGAERAILTLMAGTDRTRWDLRLAHHPAAALEPLVAGTDELGVPRWELPRMDPGFEGAARLPGYIAGLRRHRPDIVHLHLSWPLACQYALVGAFIARVPAVVATAQLYVDVKLSARVRWQQRLYTRAVDRYIAVSSNVADELVEGLDWPREKIDVVDNSIDVDAFARSRSPALRAELTNGSEQPVVLTPARLDAQKGQRDLLQAATMLRDVRVVFAGDGPDRAALEALALELRVDDRTTFLGHRGDVVELMAASDLVVLPSWYEGLPLSLLEAMAVGAPIVATKIGGVDELVRHEQDGLLVEPRSPRALADAIERLLRSPDEARTMARSAREHVRAQFDAAVMSRRVAAIYDEVLGG